MGQIFNRLRRIAKAKISAAKDELLKYDFLRDRWDAGHKWGEEKSEEFDRKWNDAKETFREYTNYIPYSLSKSYTTLGISFGADIETVRKAWKELLRKNHPDLFQDPTQKDAATKKAAAINEAFQNIENYFKKNPAR